MKISLSRIHFPITSLGPGNRIGIWFQGCSVKCAGCISLDTWSENTGITTIDAVIESISAFVSKADGFTISGGEPFDQADALIELLRRIRSLSEKDILVYSGHSFEKLEVNLARMDGLIDALITDPFVVEDLQTLPLRGSDNQRLHFLTKLGETRFEYAENSNNSNFDNLDVMFDGLQTLWVAGIPRRGDLTTLVGLLEEQGFQASTTEYVGASKWES